MIAEDSQRIKLGSEADRVIGTCPVCGEPNAVTTVAWWEKDGDGGMDHMDNQDVFDPRGTCDHFVELVRDGPDAYLTFRAMKS